jgi:hypothetical protein
LLESGRVMLWSAHLITQYLTSVPRDFSTKSTQIGWVKSYPTRSFFRQQQTQRRWRGSVYFEILTIVVCPVGSLADIAASSPLCPRKQTFI